MLRFLLTAVVLCLLASVIPTQAAEPSAIEYPPRPVPVELAASKMTVPPGFAVSLFAGEPDVVQPIGFTFDDRGRMWVAECLSYPKWTKDGTGRDRITIYEDTDGDGRHDRRTLFADNLANLSGLEVGFGGVYICSLPKLMFIPDRNYDDKPDGPAETVLDGWDENCRHNVFNGLAWGPDGWLYGLNGILSRSKVGRPGAPDAERKYLDCGVWRYHPTRHDFEPVASGTTNPWGIDWDDYGEMFITNCVIKHIFHVVPGGHYERMFGADPNPHVYGLMPSCADHIHWAGGHWTDSRGALGAHGDAGGGHAHSGCSIYLGDNFPPEYRNNAFMCNIHGARLNRDTLVPQGSTYVAKHEKDFLFANDPWHRGLGVKYGPDGGLFVSDWCDTGECHNYDVADTTNGRIVKVTYGTPMALKPFDLQKMTDAELVDLQAHPNDWWVRHARRVLQERAAAKTLKPETSGLIWNRFNDEKDERRRLRYLWAMNGVDGLAEEITVAMEDESEHVRTWAVTLATDSRPVGELVRDMVVQAAGDESPKVRARVASIASRLDRKQAIRVSRSLLTNDQNNADGSLPHLTWYALQASSAITDGAWSTRAPIINAARDAKIPLVRSFAARYAIQTATTPGEKSERIGELLHPSYVVTESKTEPSKLVAPSDEMLEGILTGIRGTRDLPEPKLWAETIYPALSGSSSSQVRDTVDRLGVVFGNEALLTKTLATLADDGAKTEARRRALELLVPKRRPDLLPVLLTLLDADGLRGDALRALASYDDSQVPAAVLGRFGKLTDAEKTDALQTLASRASYGMALLDAVEAGKLDRREVPSGLAVQLSALKNKPLNDRLAKVWGAVRPTAQARIDQAAKLKKLLTGDALGDADLAKGNALYKKTCAACHKLYGEGGAIGPELTGSQRFNLDYVLENVLDPSAKVGRLFLVSVLELADGRVVQGVVAEENEQAVTIQTATERTVIAKSEIESRTETRTSLMPDGLFDRLSDEEIRDLVGYLTSRK
jgi:putative membrane-bound dehydrogenase-like protein